jgi:hypothetical protein
MALAGSLVVVALLTTTAAFAADVQTSKPFSGTTVNGGTVKHAKQGKKTVLTLSDDFRVPDSPDPHWQVVDSKGSVYRLDKLTIKDNKVNKTITLPRYIKDVAKVQMWCAFAEVLLGEATFDTPLK